MIYLSFRFIFYKLYFYSIWFKETGILVAAEIFVIAWELSFVRLKTLLASTAVFPARVAAETD
jgi:hypothetical protein